MPVTPVSFAENGVKPYIWGRETFMILRFILFNSLTALHWE
jgi:hypothetical protein